MENRTLLQFREHELDPGATLAAYTEALTQQGFPQTHEQLLRELLAWRHPNAASHAPALETVQQVLDIENDILLDASVTGTAAEHMPFLYTVIGRVFSGGRAFQQTLLRAAHDAEQAHEDTIHQYMQERGCDRLEAVQLMEATALQRLQERQEQILYAIETSLDEDNDAGMSR